MSIYRQSESAERSSLGVYLNADTSTAPDGASKAERKTSVNDTGDYYSKSFRWLTAENGLLQMFRYNIRHLNSCSEVVLVRIGKTTATALLVLLEGRKAVQAIGDRGPTLAPIPSFGPLSSSRSAAYSGRNAVR